MDTTLRQSVIPEGASLTFADYSRLTVDIEDLLAQFGYSLLLQNYELPHAEMKPEMFEGLKTRLERSLFHVNLSSEVVRREFLIAPVLLEVAFYTGIKIKVEYPLTVNEQLRGTLDYLLVGKETLLVVEAKHADPQRGFTQLAVELIALDQWLAAGSGLIYGAVTMGDLWRFGVLDRQHKTIVQDVQLYRVPADLDELLAILIGILQA